MDSSVQNNVWPKQNPLLAKSPVLALFDPTLHTTVSTNPSDFCLGVIFSQVSLDGIEQTAAFAARTPSTVERKICHGGKGCASMHVAVESGIHIEWHTYLWGRRFTLRTDHQALTTMLGHAGLCVGKWSAGLIIQLRCGIPPRFSKCPCWLSVMFALIWFSCSAVAAVDDVDEEFVDSLSAICNSLSADVEAACASNKTLYTDF